MVIRRDTIELEQRYFSMSMKQPLSDLVRHMDALATIPDNASLISDLRLLHGKPKNEQLKGLADIISRYGYANIEYVINNGDKTVVDPLIYDESASLLTRNCIPIYLSSFDCGRFSQETLLQILDKHPDSIYHIPQDMISLEMAEMAITGEPELFRNVPVEFQTLEMVRKIPPHPMNYVNVQTEFQKVIFQEWIEGKFEFKSHLSGTKHDLLKTPQSPRDIFKLYQSTRYAGFDSTFFTVMFDMMPYLLGFYDPAQCWADATLPEEKDFVIQAFGKEALLEKAEIPTDSKRKWLEDSLGI